MTCVGRSAVIASVYEHTELSAVMGTPKETKDFSLEQLERRAAGLRAVAARMDAAIAILREAGVEAIEIPNWKSGDLAVQRFSTFSKSLHSAVDELLLQMPDRD